jgi:hypothetical protein
MTGSTAPAPRRASSLHDALNEEAHHLVGLGYRGLDGPGGGGDLVVASAQQLVFCRLHAQRGLDARADRREPPSRHELRRVGCRRLTCRRDAPWSEVRFDLLFVTLSQHGELVGVEHHPDAF